MGGIDLPTALLTLAGVTLAIGLSVAAGTVAARLMYAASRRHRDDL